MILSQANESSDEGICRLCGVIIRANRPTGEAVGVGAGVLLLALEPLEGIDPMERLRGGAGVLNLARGPGRYSADGLIALRVSLFGVKAAVRDNVGSGRVELSTHIADM